ncbi:ATP-binding protein [Actinocorallia sp. A-T 12471]|uniref:ATP-binding protein n=1 Tax=Actinocorallia sp. A-T 12471 TaxID=3089813 RepID=UPI0029D00E62|nr:ATP-binding protein [Actinocorallia sp. A-T 12471]MDX6742926.1 ATP-binding protein [Actinocorallia sp. A-T 12471]
MTNTDLVSDDTALRWIHEQGDLSWRRAFRGPPCQVKQARRFISETLDGSGSETEASTIVTELATNAIRHTPSGEGGWFGVEVTRNTAIVKLSVTDLGDGKGLNWDNSEFLDEGGRGLFVVRQMARSVGAARLQGLGHVVWATLQTAERRM